MKDAFDIIKELIQKSNEEMFSCHYLYGHRPNGNLVHYVSVECNGGVHFFTHVTNADSREITTGEFIKLIEWDQDKHEKKGWL